MEDGEYPFLCVDTSEDAADAGLLQPFIQMADTAALSLESGGLCIAVAGIRIARVSIAGEDGRG